MSGSGRWCCQFCDVVILVIKTEADVVMMRYSVEVVAMPYCHDVCSSRCDLSLRLPPFSQFEVVSGLFGCDCHDPEKERELCRCIRAVTKTICVSFVVEGRAYIIMHRSVTVLKIHRGKRGRFSPGQGSILPYQRCYSALLEIFPARFQGKCATVTTPKRDEIVYLTCTSPLARPATLVRGLLR